jgi:hypothetical protein
MMRLPRFDPWVVPKVAVVAGACAAWAAAAACLTTPPPDLPRLPVQGPTIDNASVRPQPGLLVDWPVDNQFIVPVRVATPGESFVYEVVYDWPTNQVLNPATNLTPQFAADGGVANVLLTLLPPPPDGVCPHQIDFVVANSFASEHTPDSVGGDLVFWTFTGGGVPNGCPSFDAGTGAFPEASAITGGD